MRRKRDLELENRRLREELNRINKRFRDTPPLERCTSQKCITCIHSVTGYSSYIGLYLMGCGKNQVCPDYKTKDELPVGLDK